MSFATNERRDLFCIAIASGLTAEKAYISAGYSANGASQSASRMLRNAQIRARIRGLRKDIAERAIAKSAPTKNYVISQLMTIVERCMQHEPLRDKSGCVLGYARYTPMVAIRALELLGKELGMFKGRPERQKAIEHMTLEEMKQRQAELDKRLKELEDQSQTEPRRKYREPLH